AFRNLVVWFDKKTYKPPTAIEEIDCGAWAGILENERTSMPGEGAGYMVYMPVAGVTQEANLTLDDGCVNDPSLFTKGAIVDPRPFPNQCLIASSMSGDVFVESEKLRQALAVVIEVCKPDYAAVHAMWPRDRERYWLFWMTRGFDVEKQRSVRIDAEPDKTEDWMGGTLWINSRNAPEK
ncbi:MAG: hypothetical protein ACR2PZ_11205, partial [Pseudomonadales bacterium]